MTPTQILRRPARLFVLLAALSSAACQSVAPDRSHFVDDELVRGRNQEMLTLRDQQKEAVYDITSSSFSKLPKY